MDILQLTSDQLQLGFLPYRQDRQKVVAFFLKQQFAMAHGQIATAEGQPPVLASGDVFTDAEARTGLLYASDFTPFKPRADVLLQASAHAPGGVPTTAVNVKLSVGKQWHKSLLVSGPRRWEWSVLGGDKPSEPVPFTEMPITYANAWGGTGFKMNPEGVGYGRDAESFPSIEFLDRSVLNRRDNLEPAGFAPIPAAWPQRHSLFGTYTEKWIKEHWLVYPENFDFGYFNAAPRDQQIEDYLRGDEVLELHNLHPQHPIYRTQLPQLTARCFLYEKQIETQPKFREVPLVLDTLAIDMHTETMVLVWRGTTQVQTQKMHEIKRVVISTESLTQRKTMEHYYQAMRAHLAEKEAEFDVDFGDTEAEDQAFELEFSQMDAELATLNQEFADLDASVATAEAGERTLQEKLGLDVSLFDRPALESTASAYSEEMAAWSTGIDPNTLQDFSALAASAPSAAAEIQKFDDEFAAAEEEFPDEPGWTRERVVACHAAQEEMAGAELDKLDLSELSLVGADFTNTSCMGTIWRQANLSGANFTGADLTGADLTGANLTGAILNGADVRKAMLEGAILRNATLNDTDFSKVSLAGVDLTACTGKTPDFGGANLKASKFTQAQFFHANFDGANVEEADFRRANLPECDFSNANAQRSNFEAARMTNLRCSGANFAGAVLRNVIADNSIWDMALLDKADLSGSIFPRSEFTDASARATIMDRSDFSACNFEDAMLELSQFRHCNLLRASLARADLRNADLQGSNCYEASFAETRLDGCGLRGANLKQTLLAGKRHG